MNPEFKKSCKYCVALSLGIIIGVVVMKILEESPIKKTGGNSTCECEKK